MLFCVAGSIIGVPRRRTLRGSISYFEEAVRLDPEFSRAYAPLALVYALSYEWKSGKFSAQAFCAIREERDLSKTNISGWIEPAPFHFPKSNKRPAHQYWPSKPTGRTCLSDPKPVSSL
jgi:hypothetical protein